MDKDQFLGWRSWMGWTQAKVAEHLGVSKRTVQLYEAGDQPVPKAIELAAHSLAQGVREYRGPDNASNPRAGS